MKSKNVILLLLIICLFLLSCKSKQLKNDIENAFITLYMMANLALLGITALACGFGYSKRKRPRESLKVVSIILLALFTVITFRLYSVYSFSLVENPKIGFLFFSALVIIAITVLQLIRGSRRQIDNLDEMNDPSKMLKNDEEIPPDQEIH